jgi:hypothetical protein
VEIILAIIREYSGMHIKVATKELNFNCWGSGLGIS